MAPLDLVKIALKSFPFRTVTLSLYSRHNDSASGVVITSRYLSPSEVHTASTIPCFCNELRDRNARGKGDNPGHPSAPQPEAPLAFCKLKD